MGEKKQTMAELAVEYMDKHYPASEYVDRVDEWLKLEPLEILRKAGFKVKHLKNGSADRYYAFADGSITDNEMAHLFKDGIDYNKHLSEMSEVAWSRYSNNFYTGDILGCDDPTAGCNEWDHRL